MIIKFLRKNIGTIIAFLGFMLLCIATFGDLGEFMTDKYWENVIANITSISFLAIALAIIQVSIKQGLAEQALQNGLNTENTTNKYNEHKNIIKKNTEKMIFLPYFLETYNKRHTTLKKREFLVDNNFTSENLLLKSKRKKLIRKYYSIKVIMTARSIKWSTTDIVYNKYGQITTLQEHRAKRISNAIFSSIMFMIGVTLLTKGLFFDGSNELIWQKIIKLFTYIISIAIGSIFSIIKEYEKGAFGVPNDLDELNQIWNEFTTWEVPSWVKVEIDVLNEKEVYNGQESSNIDSGANIQKEQKEEPIIFDAESGDIIPITDASNSVLCIDDREFDR